jgi:hypothetical protein
MHIHAHSVVFVGIVCEPKRDGHNSRCVHCVSDASINTMCGQTHSNMYVCSNDMSVLMVQYTTHIYIDPNQHKNTKAYAENTTQIHTRRTQNNPDTNTHRPMQHHFELNEIPLGWYRHTFRMEVTRILASNPASEHGM